MVRTPTNEDFYVRPSFNETSNLFARAPMHNASSEHPRFCFCSLSAPPHFDGMQMRCGQETMGICEKTGKKEIFMEIREKK
jgi:hypothetical protein